MSSENGKPWRFVTNHTQVLLCIAQDSDVRLRDIAQIVGITERAAQRIVADLAEAGYVTIERVGRRNRYSVAQNAAMRHEAQAGHEIGELLNLLRLDAAPIDTHPSSKGPVRAARRAIPRSS